MLADMPGPMQRADLADAVHAAKCRKEAGAQTVAPIPAVHVEKSWGRTR
jgi:hypothetical protein